VQNWDNALI